MSAIKIPYHLRDAYVDGILVHILFDKEDASFFHGLLTSLEYFRFSAANSAVRRVLFRAIHGKSLDALLKSNHRA